MAMHKYGKKKMGYSKKKGGYSKKSSGGMSYGPGSPKGEKAKMVLSGERKGSMKMEY